MHSNDEPAPAGESITWFCPHCWATVRRDAQTCPACGAPLAAYSDLSYEEKLLGALRHPVRENRMIAIQTAGEKRLQGAVPELANIVHNEEDIYLVREALRALAAIGTEEALQVVSQARRHASPVIRRLAKEG